MASAYSAEVLGSPCPSIITNPISGTRTNFGSRADALYSCCRSVPSVAVVMSCSFRVRWSDDPAKRGARDKRRGEAERSDDAEDRHDERLDVSRQVDRPQRERQADQDRP